MAVLNRDEKTGKQQEEQKGTDGDFFVELWRKVLFEIYTGRLLCAKGFYYYDF